MRPQKVDDIVLINNLMSVIRSKGYDGASLNELAAASGLQKASLYHRFPGGKKDIVMSVLNHINEWTNINIINVINNTNTSPENKLNTIIQNLNIFYDSGNNACIMKTLSMDNSFNLFGDYLKQGMQVWIKSFIELGLLFNLSESKSKTVAEQVLIQIQGSLVLSKTLGNNTPFIKALENIKELYQ